jgi:hypothetical protein
MWNEISKPENYDPNNDAFFDYQQAVEHFVPIPIEMENLPHDAWPEEMKDSLLSILEDWLAENRQTLEHLKAGTERPFLYLKDTYMDNFLMASDFCLDLGKIIRLAQVIGWQAKFNATNGRIDDAINNLIAGHRLAKHFTGRKPILYYLISMSIKATTIKNSFLVLERAELDSRQLAYLQKQLELQSHNSDNELDFTFERLEIYDAIQRMFTDDGKGNGRLSPKAASLLMSMSPPYVAEPQSWDVLSESSREAHAYWLATTGPDRKQTMEMTDKVFDYYESLTSKACWQICNVKDASQKKIDAMLEDSILMMWKPSFGILHMRYRSLNQQNALIVTIAILRYKADNGKLPQKLDDLVSAGFLKELPVDTCSEKSFVYRQTDSNFILYGIGPGLTDDGGIPGDWGDEDTDIVFWPVRKRD